MATQILPTAGAVIFGNQNDNLLSNTIGMIEQERQRTAQQRVQEAQKLANSWRQNMLSASSGRLWSDEIAKIEQDHVMKGEQLMSQGVDPYSSTDPRAVQYRQERMQVENMQNFRKGMEAEYKAINDVVRRDPNKWETADINKLNEFISGNKFNDVYEQNMGLPTVNQRFNVADAIKGYRAPVKSETVVEGGQEKSSTYVDRDEAEQGVLSRISQSPNSQEFMNRLTGGFSVSQLRNAPSDLEGATALMTGFYDTNPAFREELAKQGITSKNDPMFQQAMATEASELLSAKQNYEQQMDELISSVSGGITTKTTVKPNNTEANELRAQRREQREIVRFNERHLKKSSGGSGSSSESVSYSPSNKEYVAYTDYNGKMAKAPMYGFTKFNANGVEFIGNNVVDLETGQLVPDQAVRSGTVVALGVVPSGRNNRTLSQENFAKSNPDNVEWRKMALVESTESGIGSKSTKRQYMVPAENLPDNMPKKTLYDKFMGSSFTPPSSDSSKNTSTPKSNNTKPKASSTTLNFFK